MDPQHRLLLEVTQHALDDAGVVQSKNTQEDTAVLVALSNDDHKLSLQQALQSRDAYRTAGTARGLAAGRISHHFGFNGLSITVDAGCASTLTALDIASNELKTGRCSMAIVGAVNLTTTIEPYLMLKDAGLLSNSGNCNPLDQCADGTVRGEGAGVVVLKRLGDVLPTDRVYAKLIGSVSAYCGGRERATSPSEQAQTRMLSRVLEIARIPPTVVDYAELHAAGHPSGDACELRALGQILGVGRASDAPCLIGSVKSAIGNLEAAAGMASLIKVALCLSKRHWVPNSGLAAVRQDVPLKALGLRPILPEEGTLRADQGAVATVTALSYGGNAACAVLQALPEPHLPSELGKQRKVLCLSASTRSALNLQFERYADFLGSLATTPIEQVCFASRECRTARRHRAALIGNSTAMFVDQLRALARDERPPDTFVGVATASEVNDQERSSSARAHSSTSLEQLSADWVCGTNVVFPLPVDPELRRNTWLPSVPFERQEPSRQPASRRPPSHVSPSSPRVLLTLIDELSPGAASRLEPDTYLAEVGIDSIKGLELVERLERTLGVQLPRRVHLGHFTLESLRELLRTIERRDDTQA